MELALSVVLTAAGLVMLCYGGSWLAGGGASIARRLGVSNIVIGMTIVAYGTSAPELAASLAAVGEHSAIALGNVVGSNIANIGMVIGISAILVPLAVDGARIRKEMLVMAGASALLVILSLDGEISRYDGALLVALLVVFTALMCRSIRRDRRPAGRGAAAGAAGGSAGGPAPDRRIQLRPFGMLGAGIAFLYVGSELAIGNAVGIAQAFDIPERIIGLTVIAVGTSLPELITSVAAIRNGHTDIGIGNIVGSNIYNILMIMGAASALAGVAVADGIYLDYAVMAAFMLALFAAMRTGSVARWIGAGMVGGYAAYLAASYLYL